MESNIEKAFRYFRERQYKETPLQKMIDMETNKTLERDYTLDKPENTVFCSTNAPEVQEFIELSSIPVETDGIDEQKVTKSKWQSLTSSEDGLTSL